MCIRDSLSIIDVSGGHQPIYNPDKTKWIVFNGEIYNYQSPVSYTHLRAHETVLDLVCRLLLEKKKTTISPKQLTQQKHK